MRDSFLVVSLAGWTPFSAGASVPIAAEIAARQAGTFTPEMLEKVLLKGLPATTKALRIMSKILNPDGSYNTDTAREQGWTIPAPSSSEAVTPRSPQQ